MINIRFPTELKARATEGNPFSRKRSYLRGRRILIVEDDDRLYCALKDALHDAGCDVLGRHVALWDVDAHAQVDVALVGGNDTQAQAILSIQLQQQGVPTILISPRRIERETAAVRADVQLTRPFTEEELVFVLAEALDVRRLRADSSLTKCERGERASITLSPSRSRDL